MDKASRQTLLAFPVILFIAALLVLAGSQGGYRVQGIPIFALCAALAFVIQWIAFLPAFLFQTEAFYDLTGSLTYLAVIGISLWLLPVKNDRAVLLGGLVSIWTVRLGYFLFYRTRKTGEDRRFRQIKPSFPKFLLAWTLQGLWVVFALAAALAAITTHLQVELGGVAFLGFVIWLVGFSFEVIADRQKSKFRALPQNKERFIQTGLWAYSRHPNYFGEIVLWIGIAVIALPALRGWQYLTLFSPLCVIVLITRISGIPMLEARADEKWGGQADFEAYKARTSLLIPLPPSKRK